MRFALIWSEAASGLRRNVSMVISVILVTFISLTFVGAAVLLQLQINQMKNYWYDRAQVAIYMCTNISLVDECPGGEATQEQLDAVRTKLQSPALSPYIEQFYFEDRQQAYENFQNQFRGNPVAETVVPEYLSQTYWVNLTDPSQADVIIETFSGIQGVENVADQRSYLDQIFSVLNAASFTAIGIAGLMLIAAALLISTTIRLSAFARRREIAIQRLVGASNGFIQFPFILEGVFAALIGSVLASAAIVAIVQFFVQGWLTTRLSFTSFIGLDAAWVVVPVLLILGVILSALSAKFAISRYLKV